MAGSAETLRIICPFIREEQIAELVHEGGVTSTKVLTLWSPRSFLTGVAQPEAFKLLLRLGAEVRAMRSGLHAKVYIADDRKALVTSANLTKGGLTDNLECGVAVENNDVLPLIENFELEWRRATPITERHLDDMLSLLQQAQEERDELLRKLRKLEARLSRGVPSLPSVWDGDTNDIVVELTPSQVEYLNRPVRGQGGYQSFLKRLQRNMNGNLLRLSRKDCEKIVRYATRYGQGGFQARLRSIVELARLFIS